MQKPTQEEVLSATDEQLNELSAVWVMKYEVGRQNIHGHGICVKKDHAWFLWNPAQNIAQAFELVEKFNPGNYTIEISQTTLDGIWVCLIQKRPALITIGYAIDTKKERAIARAALLAVGG